MATVMTSSEMSSQMDMSSVPTKPRYESMSSTDFQMDNLLDDRRIMVDLIGLSEKAKVSAGSSLSLSNKRLSEVDFHLSAALNTNGNLQTTNPSLATDLSASATAAAVDTTDKQLYVDEGSTESETETKIEQFVDPATGRTRRRLIKIVRKTKTIRERILHTAPAGSIPSPEGPLPNEEEVSGSSRLCHAETVSSSDDASDFAKIPANPSSFCDMKVQPNCQMQNYMQLLGGYDRAFIDLTRHSAQSFTLWQERWRKVVLLDTVKERCKTISYVSKETQQAAPGSIRRYNTTVSQTTHVRLVSSASQEEYTAKNNSQSTRPARVDSDVEGLRKTMSAERIYNERMNPIDDSNVGNNSWRGCNASLSLPKSFNSDTAWNLKKESYDRSSTRCDEDCTVDLILQPSLMDYLLFENTQAKQIEQGLSIKAGTVEALTIFACGSEGSGLDKILFAETFLATYRTFISAEKLVELLVRRCLHFKKLATSSGCADGKLPLQSNAKYLWRGVFSFLIRVIAELHRDLTPDVFDQLTHFREQLLMNGDFGECQILENKLKEQCTSKTEVNYFDVACSFSTKPHTPNHRPFSLRHVKPRDLAEQITILAADCYRRIEIQEYLVISGSVGSTSAGYPDPELYCCNLKRYIDNFNKLGCWMKTLVLVGESANFCNQVQVHDSREMSVSSSWSSFLSSESSREKRARRKERERRERVMLYFLKVAAELLELQNYHSYLGIVSQAVGLELNWSKEVNRQLDDIRLELADQRAFANKFYKNMSKVEPPFIPYVGSMMGYLTKLSEVTPTYIEASKLPLDFPTPPDTVDRDKWVVNFTKSLRIATIMDYFVRNKRFDSDSAQYNIERNLHIMMLINDYKDALEENALNDILNLHRKAELMHS